VPLAELELELELELEEADDVAQFPPAAVPKPHL